VGTWRAARRLGGTEWSLYLPEHDREPRCYFSSAPGQISLPIPRDEQSIPEGPGWESIATNDTENVTFRDNVSRSVVNHPFTKSTGLFSQQTQCLSSMTRTGKARWFFKTPSVDPLQPGSRLDGRSLNAEAVPHSRTVRSGRILLLYIRLAAPSHATWSFHPSWIFDAAWAWPSQVTKAV
jgi:hypothetical protein